MGELELKGKKVLGIFSIIFIVLTLLSLVNLLANNQLSILSIVSIVVQLASLYAAYQGKTWGKIVLIVLCAISIVLITMSGLLVLTISAGLGIILLLIGLATPVGTIIVLTVPKSVKAYFAYCNGKTEPVAETIEFVETSENSTEDNSSDTNI